MKASKKDSVKIVYLHDSGLSNNEYDAFLKEHYGREKWERYQEKKVWYSKRVKYKVLLAIVNGKPVGQSCAFCVNAVVHGKEISLWWGVDMFVLSDWRGYGIGKMLQQRLHQDLPNFSSAWYSPINGIIKRKCGAKEHFKLYFPYYAVSRYLSVFFELAIKKFFRMSVQIPFRIPNIYAKIQLRFGRLNKYTIEEINDFSDLDTLFIHSVLGGKDFFIKRDLTYLRWKYFDNPSLPYSPHIIRVYREGRMIALFTFVEAIECTYLSVRVVTPILLDTFICDENLLDERDILSYIVEYHSNMGVVIDGIQSLQNIRYWAKIIYPLKGAPFLSTYTGDINSYYISFMDQDMEQIGL